MARSKRRLTVGSLFGVPQHGKSTQGGRLAPLPPSKRGRGCCRKMCAGCPWAEAQRQRR